jgi:hypothetical protein
MWLFFYPFSFPPSVVLLDFFYRVFGRFVTRGIKKNAIKKSRGKFSAAAKKVLTYLLALLFFFYALRPLLL